MTVTVDIDYSPLETLQAKLQQLDDMLKQRINDELEEAAATLKETAQQLAPVKTGYLCSTIFAQVNDDAIQFGATASYAYYVEYGTRRIQPRRFLSQSLEINIPKIISALNEAVEKTVSETATL